MLSTWTKKPINYGILNDAYSPEVMPNCRLKAGEIFKTQSGKFVSKDTGTGHFDASVAADTEIQGYAKIPSRFTLTGWVNGVYTVHASIEEYVDVIRDINARFCVPATGTFSDAKKGKTCDIDVTSNVQSAAIDLSSTDVLVIYELNSTLSLAEVGLNPLKMFITGVI